MNEEVVWLLKVRVKPGQRDSAVASIQAMIEGAAQRSGTVAYECFEGEDSALHLLERYDSSEAAAAHIHAFSAQHAEAFLAAVEPIDLCVYGVPSEVVRELLTPFAPNFLKPVGSFRRSGEPGPALA